MKKPLVIGQQVNKNTKRKYGPLIRFQCVTITIPADKIYVTSNKITNNRKSTRTVPVLDTGMSGHQFVQLSEHRPPGVHLLLTVLYPGDGLTAGGIETRQLIETRGML